MQRDDDDTEDKIDEMSSWILYRRRLKFGSTVNNIIIKRISFFLLFLICHHHHHHHFAVHAAFISQNILPKKPAIIANQLDRRTWIDRFQRGSIIDDNIHVDGNDNDDDDFIDKIPHVWVEDAEDGFVDHEENLETGEICLKAVKAFASSSSSFSSSRSRIISPSTNDDTYEVYDVFSTNNNKKKNSSDDRFLCAGAIVQRPTEDADKSLPSAVDSPNICDVWIADSMDDDVGPNIQLQGALQVVDELLLYFLEYHQQRQQQLCEKINTETNLNVTQLSYSNVDVSISSLRNFVVQCSSTNDHTCASYIACQLRGFIPIKEAIRKDSIYSRNYYCYYGDTNDLDGMVLDPVVAKERYVSLAEGCLNSAITPMTTSTDDSVVIDDDTEDGSACTEDNNDTVAAMSSSLTPPLSQPPASTALVAQKILKLFPNDDTIGRHTFKRFTVK